MLRFPPVMSRRQLEVSGYLKALRRATQLCVVYTERRADVFSAVDPRRERRRLDRSGDHRRSRAKSGRVLPCLSACSRTRRRAGRRLSVRVRGGLFSSRAVARSGSTPIFRCANLSSSASADSSTAGGPGWSAPGASRMCSACRTKSIMRAIRRAPGQLRAALQVGQSLKFELLIPIRSDDQPTACMSFNYHRDHFGKTWGLVDEDVRHTHAGCVAFGMDRLALALFATHELEISVWPRAAREALDLGCA